MRKRLIGTAIGLVAVLIWTVTSFSAEIMSNPFNPHQVTAAQPQGPPLTTWMDTDSAPEITLDTKAASCDTQLASLLDQRRTQDSKSATETAALKKAVADATSTSSEKDKTIFALRTQAADALTKLAAQQSSVENEVFRLLAERATSVKLRGFGPVQLVPLLNDYLVVIQPELAKDVDRFFGKIRKVIVTGKAGTYLICDRKYFVSVTSSASAAVGKEGTL